MSKKEIICFVEKILKKNDKLYAIYGRIRAHPWYYLGFTLLFLYLYGMAVNSFLTASHNFRTGDELKTLSLNPFKCFSAVFTPQSLGMLFFIAAMYFLITGKLMPFITGVKVTKDERNFYVSNEGTHGTSGWMDKAERQKVLVTDKADALPCPILGRLKSSPYDGYSDYIGLRKDSGLNKHVMVYGASGAGKSRGFVKPFILKTASLRQSMVIVDPKAEFFEQMSGYLKDQGYVVKAFNLLDMENSDGWNCIGETEGDVDMVQSVAEVIIRNTSGDGQKADFWDKSEQNLLIALILYVQSMRDPVTNELLPIHERSLGTIYRMLSTEGPEALTQSFSAFRWIIRPALHTVFLNRRPAIYGEIFLSVLAQG